jgi:protein O-mannosyl-transferase
MKTPTQIRKQRSPTPGPRSGPPELASPLIFVVAAVALVAAVAAIYSPTIDYQFILDDHHYVGDPRVQTPGHVWEYFTTYVWAQFTGGPSSFYRPLFILWLRLNYLFCGLSPGGWHFLSIVKHLVAVAFLGLLAWKLLRDRTAVLLAMTLFALHPSHTESVAWISVPDPLMSAGIVASLLLSFKYADSVASERQPRKGNTKKVRKVEQSGPKTRLWLIASAIGCFVALLTKETSIILPAVIFALAFAMPAAPPESNRQGAFSNRFVAAIFASLPFVAASAVYFLLRRNALGGVVALTQHLPWRTVLLSWPTTLWFYVKGLLWPVKSGAFADSIPADRFSLGGVLLPALAVCSAAAILGLGLVWLWRKSAHDLPQGEVTGVHRALIVGSLILVLPILLTLNLNTLVPGDFLHGRYVYLPSMGLMLLVATAWRVSDKNRVPLLCAAGLVACAYVVFTLQQEDMWKDDLTVFTAAHDIAPRNEPVRLSLSRARVQSAIRLDEEGRCDEAIPILEEATRQYPRDWFAWAGLGECYFKLNDLPKAEQSLHRASDLAHQPRVTEQWHELRSRMGLSAEP